MLYNALLIQCQRSNYQDSQVLNSHKQTIKCFVVLCYFMSRFYVVCRTPIRNYWGNYSQNNMNPSKIYGPALSDRLRSDKITVHNFILSTFLMIKIVLPSCAHWCGSTKFDECGSGSRSKNHKIDFSPSFKSREKKNIFKSVRYLGDLLLF